MSKKQVVIVSIHNWGHAKGQLHLAKALLELDKALQVTFINHIIQARLLEAEAKLFGLQQTGRFQIVYAKTKAQFPAGNPVAMLNGLLDDVATFWHEIRDELIKGCASGIEPAEGWSFTQPAGKAGLLVMDFFAGGKIYKGTAPNEGIPVLAHWPSTATSVAQYFGPVSHGGSNWDGSPAKAIFEDESRRNGRILQEIEAACFLAGNGTDKADGKLIRLPSIDPLFDYELFPTPPPPPSLLHFEPEGVKGLDEWYTRALGKPAYPTSVPHNQRASPTLSTDCVATAFLDKALKSHGARSTWFISFGSIFFPPVIAHVEALLERLRLAKIPFVFLLCSGRGQAIFPQELRDDINKSGDGVVISQWIDQVAVLRHKALDYFVTHTGFNSTIEAIDNLVPLVFWPCGAEQPTNAATFSTGALPIGFELLEVRLTKLAPHRTGRAIEGTPEFIRAEIDHIIEQAKGDGGKLHRENLVKVREKMQRGRDEESVKGLRGILAVVDSQ